MKLSRFAYTVIVISATIILLSLGFYLGFTNMTNKAKSEKSNDKTSEVASNKPSEMNHTIPTNEQPVEQVNAEPIVDIEIVYVDYYIKCNHSVEDRTNAYGARMSEIKKEHDENQEKQEYELTEESEEKIVYTKKHDSYCGEHFLVKIDNGKVVVYNHVNDGIYPLFKETNILEEKIRDTLKTELQKGVFVNSKEELYTLLEDAES